MIRAGVVAVTLVIMLLLAGGWQQTATTHSAVGSHSRVGETALIALTDTTATSIPPGDQLLAQMQQAMQTAGSARYVTMDLSITKMERVTVTTHADISWRRNLLREHDLTRTIVLSRNPVVSTIDRRTLLFAHQTAASRSSLSHNWYCEQLHGVHIGNSFLPFQVGTPSATNLGAATVGEVAVWHVRATGVPIPTLALRDATIDFYIEQADHALQLLDMHGMKTLAGKTSDESLTERYSRYGERVTVTLPAACR